jgi:hypothetical protein
MLGAGYFEGGSFAAVRMISKVSAGLIITNHVKSWRTLPGYSWLWM